VAALVAFACSCLNAHKSMAKSEEDVSSNPDMSEPYLYLIQDGAMLLLGLLNQQPLRRTLVISKFYYFSFICLAL
jgi:hypothetical protein